MFQKFYQKLQTKEGLMLVVSSALIIATITLVFGGFSREYSHGYSDADQRSTIMVSGTGEVFAIPDTAQFGFTVTRDAQTMAEAQKLVSEIGNSLVGKLVAVGIDKKDIKTQGFTAYPKYENQAVREIACLPGYCPPANPVIVGYTVSHDYSVKVRNLEKAPEVAKMLTDAGVTAINGPDFTLADSDALKNEARHDAIRDARAQAKLLASQLDVRLGDIVDFQVIENGNYPMPLYARTMSSDAGMMEKSIAPELQPGQSNIKVQVQITYIIRD